MELDQKEFGTLTEKLESYASQVSKLQTTIQMQNEIKEVQAENERERLENMRLVLLPQLAEKAYNELARMGMPTGDGYSLKTFTKYYQR